ncbi:MAG: MATE family efflux transporter [Chloroflexota bacterium]
MAHSLTKQEGIITSGNIHRSIWYLAPAMVMETGVLNLVQVMDTYWVSRLGSAALAAVTISVTVRWVLNSMANGLGIGGMAVIARRTGERNSEAANHAVWQVILLGLMVSAVLSVTGLILRRPILTALGARSDVLPLGMDFLKVAFTGMAALVLFFAINAMFRGAGEARIAMYVLSTTTAVTVLLQPFLVVGVGPIPGLGVAGSALAFVLGLCVGLSVQIVILLSGKARIRLRLRSLHPDFHLMGRIVSIALPSTIQMTLRSSSRLAIMALVAAYGTYATAGYGVANRLLLIALIPVFGMGNTAGTLVGQNLGAEEPNRAEKGAWWVAGYATIYMTAATVLLYVFTKPLISFFDPTPEVVSFGTDCLRIIGLSMIATSAGVVLARALDGAGNTVPAAVINLVTLWATEVPVAIALSKWSRLGLDGVWWGRAIANLANGVLFFSWFKKGRWKDREV